MMEDPRHTLGVLLEAWTAGRGGIVMRLPGSCVVVGVCGVGSIRFFLCAQDVGVGGSGSARPLSRWVRITGRRPGRAGWPRLRAEACDMFVLFERALTRGDIVAGHVDALAQQIR